MAGMDLPLQGGFQALREETFNASRTVNFYSVYSKMGKKFMLLRRFDGLLSVVDTLTGHVGRGAFVLQNQLFVVVGSNAYVLDTALNPTFLGALGTATGFVDIDANQRQPVPQVLFVDGVSGWVWDGAVWAEVTDVNFPPKPLNITYQNFRFIVPSGESDKAYISEVNNALNWTNIDGNPNVLQITQKPDFISGSAALNGILFLFGQYHIEAFNYDANLVVPYSPDNSFVTNAGLAATASLVESGSIDDSGNGCLFFLANTKDGKPSVMKMSGTSLIKLSSPELEDVLQSYQTLSDFTGFSYTEGGHTFYQFSSTENDHTWVYDDVTQEIVEKEMLDGSRFIAQAHAYFNSKNYYLSYNNGNVYQGDRKYFNNDGEVIRRYRIVPVLSDENELRIRVDRLKIFYKQSTGTLQDPNPNIRASISFDGGKLYQPPRTIELAPIGDGDFRAIERNWGVGRNIVFKLESTSDVDLTLYGAHIDYEVLPA